MREVESRLDQALRDAFDYYKAKGMWDKALSVMREAANRHPEKYKLDMDQALLDAFAYPCKPC